MPREGLVSAIDNPVDVAIVGFGPVGAALAGLLGRRGVRVLVLERDPDVFPMPRAAHVDHTGLRTWQEIGVLDQLLPGMKPNAGLRFVNAKGELLTAVASAQGSLSGLPPSMYFFQPVLDRMVRDFVSGLPTVAVELGTTVTALEEVDCGVRIQAVDVDGAAREFSASWVVACDGPSSAPGAAGGRRGAPDAEAA
jgi:3-(3-hydroxy-phenyl)propionate hydroxylase